MEITAYRPFSTTPRSDTPGGPVGQPQVDKALAELTGQVDAWLASLGFTYQDVEVTYSASAPNGQGVSTFMAIVAYPVVPSRAAQHFGTRAIGEFGRPPR
jgi:hypothetical protein